MSADTVRGHARDMAEAASNEHTTSRKGTRNRRSHQPGRAEGNQQNNHHSQMESGKQGGSPVGDANSHSPEQWTDDANQRGERATQLAVGTRTPDVIEAAPSKRKARSKGKNADADMALLRTQCLKLSLSILSRPDHPTRSLGFTSATPGEGKSFLAMLTATTLAEQGKRAITLVDCNWEAPALHEHFSVPASPGLAEWLRQECELDDIRHCVSPRLTVIPAGNGQRDAVALTDALKTADVHTLLSHSGESLIADMSSILTTPYGALLSQQLNAVLLVVRARVTWDSFVQEACQELRASALEGVVLNATRSSIPRWLQRIL